LSHPTYAAFRGYHHHTDYRDPQRSRGTTCRAVVRLKGHTPAYRTLRKLAAAKDLAPRTEIAMRDRGYAACDGRTLADAIDTFLGAELPDKTDQRMLAACLHLWRGRLGAVRLRDLTAQQIARELDRSAISAVLTWAERQSPPWIARNPAKHTKHQTEPQGRMRFLSAEERSALLAAAGLSTSDGLHLAVVLGLATRARQGEVMVFHDTRNGDARRVPVPREVTCLLHRSQQTTKRYAHLTESRLRGLIDQAANKHQVI
jgi:hypothetical protein